LFWKRRKTFSYTCSCCGEKMSGSPSFGMSRPPFLLDVPAADYDARVQLNDDACWIKADEKDLEGEDIFAIRVILEVHIHGVEEPFSWGVWATQSKESFIRYLEGVGTDQTGEVSFGWLPVTMPGYKRTSDEEPFEYLACDVVWQDVGLRPKLFLHDSDHPLFIDHRDGVSWERAVEIAQLQMDGSHKLH
jgi:hypothetical protein